MIRMMHYDPRWPQEFEQTKSGVLQSCQGDVVDVQHIGSTAIAGLIAQPIVDIAAAVAEPLRLPVAAQAIEGMYFRRLTTPPWAGDAWLLAKPRHGEITHQILLTSLDSVVWQRVLAVRDALRSDPERAVGFEEFKVRHWKAGEGDPQRYRQDKSLWFSHLEEQLGLEF